MTEAVIAVLFAVCGLVVGGAYFALVKRTAHQLVTGEVRISSALGATALRMLLFAPGAIVAAAISLLALAGYMLGFLAARLLTVHVAARGAPS